MDRQAVNIAPPTIEGRYYGACDLVAALGYYYRRYSGIEREPQVMAGVSNAGGGVRIPPQLQHRFNIFFQASAKDDFVGHIRCSRFETFFIWELCFDAC